MTRALLPILVLILAVGLALSAAGPAAAQGPTIQIQLAVLLDGSGSINGLEWDTQIDGLIAALEDPSCIPRDGSVELTVIQFGSNSNRLEWGPQVITNDTWGNARNAVNSIVKLNGNTPLDLAINRAAVEIRGSPDHDPEATQIINIATDGGRDLPWSLRRAPAEAARDAAIAAGIDEIDAEGIGDIPLSRDGWADVEWLKDCIVHPGYPSGPGNMAPPFTAGWVYMVGVDSGKFKEAIGHKIPTPEPTYQVDVSSNPTEGGTVEPGSGQYVGNTMFTAIEEPGYDFVNWTINQVTGETDNPLTLDIQAATTLVANFSEETPSPTLPNCPSNLSATAISSSQIDLSWDDNSDNELGFKIERSDTGAEGTYSPLATVGAGVENYHDIDLEPSTTYYYRVGAYNATGDCYSEVSATTASSRIRGCFIATAAYGTPLADEIEVLRQFRDEYLLTNPPGRLFVSVYYGSSPPLADFIDDHPALKPMVRAGLSPVVALTTVVVNTTSTEKLAIVGGLALVSLALATWLRRRAGGVNM